jgi:hypothetical protein
VYSCGYNKRDVRCSEYNVYDCGYNLRLGGRKMDAGPWSIGDPSRASAKGRNWMSADDEQWEKDKRTRRE